MVTSMDQVSKISDCHLTSIQSSVEQAIRYDARENVPVMAQYASQLQDFTCDLLIDGDL